MAVYDKGLFFNKTCSCFIYSLNPLKLWVYNLNVGKMQDVENCTEGAGLTEFYWL